MSERPRKFLTVLFVIGAFLPAQVSAFGWPVYDVTNFAVNAATAANTAAGVALQSTNWTKEYILDPLVYVLAQRVATSMVNRTLRWAQGDYTGGPGFIDDFKGFFEEAAMNRANVTINELLTNDTFSENPYAKEVARAVASNRSYLDSSLSNKLKVALDNYSEFETNKGKNFGSYGEWLESSKAYNTPTGLTALLVTSVESEIAREKEYLQTEINANGSILSKKTCAEEDSSGNCLRWTIETPGSVVADRVRQALDVPVDRINAADELSEIVAASFGSLIDGLLQIGLGKITTYTEEELTNALNNRQQIGGPEDANPGDWLNTPDIIVDLENEVEPWISDLKLVIEYYENILTNTSSGLVELAKKLDACWPGPDQGWEERVQLYLGGLSGDLSGESANIFAQETNRATEEEERMASDALVNIPGLNTIMALVESNNLMNIDTTNTINTEQLAKWKTALWTLLNIKTDIKTAAKIARPAENWTLFSDDWDALSASAKSGIISGAEATDTGNDDTNKSIVLTYYWNLWTSVVDDETKNNIRSDFYALQTSGSLPSQNIIVSARGKSNSSENTRQILLDASEDCKTLKTQVLGKNMNDYQVYGLLIGEQAKQTAGLSSIFKTDIFTNNTAIQNSVLSEITGSHEQLTCEKPSGYKEKNTNLTSISQLFEVGVSIFGNDFYNKIMTGSDLSSASKKMRDELEKRFDNVFVPWQNRETGSVDKVCIKESSSGQCQILDFCRDCSASTQFSNLASRMQMLQPADGIVQCLGESSIYAGTAFDKYSSDDGKQVKNADSVYKIFEQDKNKELFCRFENTSYGGVKPLCTPAGFDWYGEDKEEEEDKLCAGTLDPNKEVCILECGVAGEEIFNGDVISFAQDLLGDDWYKYYEPNMSSVARTIRDAMEEEYENVFVPWVDSDIRHFDAFCILTDNSDEYGYQMCYIRDFLVSSKQPGSPSDGNRVINVSTAPTSKNKWGIIYCKNFPVDDD